MEMIPPSRPIAIPMSDIVRSVGSQICSADRVEELIIPVEKFFEDCPEFVSADEATDKAIKNGNRLHISLVKDGRCRVYLSDGSFAALYEVKKGEAGICGSFLT